MGAAIAYELSQIPELKVIVLDPHPLGQGASGAALGVLMAVISQKLKGRLLKWRLASLDRYETLIPELEDQTQQVIPYNRSGILKLYTSEIELEQGHTLVQARAAQGFSLHSLDTDDVRSRYPDLVQTFGALYSPRDRQINPLSLIQALVTAAQQRGAVFHLGEAAKSFECRANQPGFCEAIVTQQNQYSADWVVISAGVGSTPLLRSLQHPLEIHPVLGQGLKIYLRERVLQPIEPVITSDDIHVVPLGNQTYWVGATVEFGVGEQPPEPDPAGVTMLLERAIAFYPALASAQILHTWTGLRPRPFERSAPIVEHAEGYENVLLATGHYRNGVLLAPVTAQLIREMITGVPSSLLG